MAVEAEDGDVSGVDRPHCLVDEPPDERIALGI